MADNTTINVGTGGDVIASDDIGGVKHQRVKLEYGADGSATDVSPVSGLPVTGGQSALSSASWTSATGANTAVSISVSGYATVSVAIVTTTTFTGGAVSFEVSPDGTNWIPIALARIDSYAVETTYAFVASLGKGWTGSVDAFSNFRVRLSTVITGTGTASIFVAPQGMPIEPMSTVGQSIASNLNALVGLSPQTSGGLSVHRRLSTADTNLVSVKASAGQLFGFYLHNTNAAVRFLKIYNKASAPVIASDNALILMTVPIPGGGTAGAGANVEWANGIPFSTGIAIAITGAVGDTDTTAVAANEVVINLFYK